MCRQTRTRAIERMACDRDGVKILAMARPTGIEPVFPP
jgi:hypothetical protein